MAAGKPGDHPVTDMLHYSMHPFPPDIEAMLRKVLALDPNFPDGKRPWVEQVAWEERIFDWSRGKNLEQGRRELRAILEEMQQ
jgi:hypothetical protein